MTHPHATQAARQKIVANAIATLRIEQLSPSQGLKVDLKAYIAGQKSSSDLLQQLQSKYVTLRRG